ncbi:MAG: amidase family protein, partial [Chloroflexi bacterium]|nr:amidase family protein [Chloroflexota bacterium]
VGLKPTHGRVPLTGHWPDTLLRFMHVGPMARTVSDTVLLLSIIAGPDGRDHYAMPVEPFKNRKFDADISKLRIGWTTGAPFAPVAAEVKTVVGNAASAFAELGCRVEEVTLDSMAEIDPVSLTTGIYAAEGGNFLEPLVVGRESELSSNMQQRMKIPAPAPKEYLAAIENLERMRAGFATVWDRHDIILCPVGPVPAHPHEQNPLLVDGREVVARSALRSTIPFDLTGSPAISVPFGWSSDGMPIGVQLVGKHFAEATVLQAAAAIEAMNKTKDKHPALNGFTSAT